MKKEFFRAVKFVFFSASAGIIQIGAFTLFNELFALPYYVSYLIALLLSVLWNFTLNRKFTFKSASNIPKAMVLTLAYYAVFTPLTTWLEHKLTVDAGWNEYAVTALNMGFNLSTEFLYQRFVVYRKSLDTAGKAPIAQPSQKTE